MESVKPVDSEAPSAFEPQKENNSAIANGVMPAVASFLKESGDEDARLLKGDGKADNPDSSAELMDELQARHWPLPLWGSIAFTFYTIFFRL